MIIKKLVTELGFKVNKAQAKQYLKFLKKLDQRASSLGKKIEKVSKAKFDSKGLKAGIEGVKRFENKLNQAGQKIENLKFKANRTGKILRRSLSAPIPTANIDNVNSKLNETKKSALNIKTALLGLTAGISFGAFAKSVFDTNTEFIKLKASLKTAVGGTAQAEKAFQRIEKFASQTPFDLQQSVKGFVQLTNLGLKPTDRSMRSFGNTATAMGKSLDQMIEAVADASTGEFERLKEFGIKASKQGKQVEFTFKGVKTKVKNDAKSIQEFLVNLGETNFASAMADQMNTLPGVISNLKDNFGAFQRAIGEGGLNEGLTELLKVFRDLGADSKPLGTLIGQVLGGALKTLAGFLRNAIDRFKEFRQNLIASGAIQAFQMALSIIVQNLRIFINQLKQSAVIANVAKTALVALGTALTGLMAIQIVGWLKSVTMALRAFSASAILAQSSALLLPIAIGAIVGALGLLIADFASFKKSGEGIFNNLSKKFPLLAPVFKTLGNVSKKLRPLFEQAFNTLKKAVKSVMPVLQELKPFFMTVLEPLKAIIESVVATVLSLGQSFIELGATAVNAILPLLAPLGQVAKALLKVGLLAVAGALKFVQWGVQVVGVVLRVAGKIISGIGRFFIFVAGRIAFVIAKFLEFGAKIVQIIIKAFTDPKQAVNDFINLVKDTATKFKDLFVKAIQTTVKTFQSGFKSITGFMKPAIDLAVKLKNALFGASKASQNIKTTGGSASGGTNRGRQTITQRNVSVPRSVRDASVPSSVQNTTNKNVIQNRTFQSASIQQTIQIQNTGQGISTDTINQIGEASRRGFNEAFSQEDKIRPRVVPGSGILQTGFG